MRAIATQEAAPDTPGPRRMLNQEQVLQIVPVSPVTLWRMEKAGRFPKSTYISPNRRVWFADEIIRWQDQVNGRGRGRANHLSEAT
jgi:prophage regulatory protein